MDFPISPLLSLKIIYDFIKPMFQDLMKNKGEKLLTKRKQKTRDDFYHLFEILCVFETDLRRFVNEFDNFVNSTEPLCKHSSCWYGLDIAGARLAKTLCKVGKSIKTILNCLFMQIRQILYYI